MEEHYQWYDTEGYEKNPVKYALKTIKADKHANRSFIGMNKENSEVEKILAELKRSWNGLLEG